MHGIYRERSVRISAGQPLVGGEGGQLVAGFISQFADAQERALRHGPGRIVVCQGLEKAHRFFRLSRSYDTFGLLEARLRHKFCVREVGDDSIIRFGGQLELAVPEVRISYLHQASCLVLRIIKQFECLFERRGCLRVGRLRECR